MSLGGRMLVLALLCGLAAPVLVSGSDSMNVAGNYSSSIPSTCDCWRWKFVPDHCGCVSPGCPYVEQVSLSTPNENGLINMSISAGADQSCYFKSEGPYQAHVDRCGHILGGSRGSEDLFDPEALDQDLDTVIIGDVLGFHGQNAGFRHTIINRWNMSLCAPNGRCYDGDRFMCFDKFHSCSGGACYDVNRDMVSPPGNAYFSRVATSALSGTYDIVEERSSPTCPDVMSAFHFGTQLGLGSSINNMRMARLVDKSIASSQVDCIQFNSICSGLQFHQYHQDQMLAGRFNQVNDKLHMTLYIISVNFADADELMHLSKCIFVGRDKAPQVVEVDRPDQTGAVIGLSVTLVLCILASAALGILCLRYRRRLLDSRVDNAYNAFET